MSNIGSEVERALNWQAKGNLAYSQKVFGRALELLDLTLDGACFDCADCMAPGVGLLKGQLRNLNMPLIIF